MRFRNRVVSTLLVVLFLLAGCSLPQESTPEAPAVPPTDIPAVNPVQQHTDFPIDLPTERSNHAGDHDSSRTAKNEEAAGGDRFTFGEYERPFNANTMDTYFPYLDIVDSLTYQDDLWIYASIQLQGRDANGLLAGNYALEIDSDVDGRGDSLILVTKPATTQWTTDGVQVWQDSDKDVGGLAAVVADDKLTSGNGFDQKVFDSGQGNDTDAAWARVSPVDPNVVQIAVKRSLVDDDGRYLAGMWSGNSALNPAQFDFNDHMTHEQAGAALRGLEIYYPIKGLAELDASCRVAVGFQPTGNEPGLCKSAARPGEPGAPTCSNSCEYGQEPPPSCMCWPG
jgi:hypothetical protein